MITWGCKLLLYYVFCVENDMPTMKEINRYVKWKHADDWKNIAIELDFSVYKLEEIDFNHKDNQAKFHSMISYWTCGHVNYPTWKALELALTNVNRQKLRLYPVDDVYGMTTHLLYVYYIHLYN